MEVVHTMFRREFGQLRGLIREATTIERARIVADHFAMVAAILHHHHSSEDDFIWPLLKARAGECVEKHLQMMEVQHFELTIRLEHLNTAIHKWVADDATPDGREAANAVCRLAELLDEHMAAEEELVVPLMEQHITADDMDAIIKEGAPPGDPNALPLTFGMLMYEGDFEIVEHAISRLPDELQPTVRNLAAESFSQYAQRIYGTMTPLRSTEI
jgi:hemerythrin-like domain-containing protein